MEKKRKGVKELRSGGIWILVVAAVLLEGIACMQYFFSRKALLEEAEKRAKSELRCAELEIEEHAIEMETAARALAMLAEKHPTEPDSIYAATRSIVKAIPHTSSVAIAFVPNYFPRHGRLFEACSSRIDADSIYTRQIGSEEHDYTLLPWYQNAIKTDSCTWSEPYLDDSGSKTYVVSCSCPVHDQTGRIIAVVCVDLSLDYLQQLSEYLLIYPSSYYSITSSEGLPIVAQPDTVPGRKYRVFDREIEATGWQIAIIIPEDVIYKELHRVTLIISIMMLIGLLVLVFIIYGTRRSFIRLMNLTNSQERMENELNIARHIQMAMLPTRFPPFPDYPHLNAYGMVDPAKEVGGDLFDFYIREDKLFFCIGDVSGKGVPASLVMAVTRSLFRSYTSYLNSPAQTVSQMNDSLTGEGNDQNMFVTLLLGTLDLRTGQLDYCNAGHDAPILMSDEQSPIAVTPNLPLGVVAGYAYTEQSILLRPGDALFLYTDGLTEAEDSAHELFGRERMMSALQSLADRKEMRQLVDGMQEAVSQFVGSAAQSDDLTMFAIRYIDSCAAHKHQTGKHYSLVMRNDIQQIPTLSEWLESISLPPNLTMPICLALEEAVSNVMLYAYPETTSGQVLVEADKTNNQVVFTITDSGIPFDPTEQQEPDITLSAEERPIGGLGIFLVRKIMDSIRYERKDDKNILTLVKNLKSEQ